MPDVLAWMPAREVTHAYPRRTGRTAFRSVHRSAQRFNYAKGLLDADREDRLKSLPGWAWDTVADRWEEGFRRRLQYVEQHGDACVPRLYVLDGYSLGPWVREQRRCYTEGKLEADRREKLEDIPGWTWKGKRGPREEEVVPKAAPDELDTAAPEVPKADPSEHLDLGDGHLIELLGHAQRDLAVADLSTRTSAVRASTVAVVLPLVVVMAGAPRQGRGSPDRLTGWPFPLPALFR